MERDAKTDTNKNPFSIAPFQWIVFAWRLCVPIWFDFRSLKCIGINVTSNIILCNCIQFRCGGERKKCVEMQENAFPCKSTFISRVESGKWIQCGCRHNFDYCVKFSSDGTWKAFRKTTENFEHYVNCVISFEIDKRRRADYLFNIDSIVMCVEMGHQILEMPNFRVFAALSDCTVLILF